MKLRTIRIIAITLAIVSAAPIAQAAVSYHVQTDSETASAKRVEDVSGPDRDGYTAITTQQFNQTYPQAELIIVTPNGTTVHTNTRYDSYFDVDPVPGNPHVVEYVATNTSTVEECDDADICSREFLVRENFKTGESQILWSRISPGRHSTRVHDIDRINDSHIVVADIYTDEVFIYDLERDVRTWTWSAQRDYSIHSGGPWPTDWTHVNDVEVINNNRTLMISLRNQDSVVFVSLNGTLHTRRTLGQDDLHTIIHEQHNPDYIEGSNPTILVADSENNRVLEYERKNKSWEATWGWTDGQLSWPRDADRLPNGHTLITDSTGNRVVEINESGEIVWSVDVGLPYEAERLNTGDESQGGPSASEAGLTSKVNTTKLNKEIEEARNENDNEEKSLRLAILSIVPDQLRQKIAFIMPPWMGFWHLPLLFLFICNCSIWGIFEFRRSSWKLQTPLHRKNS